MDLLEGMLVLDFSQYLSGPCASLRLSDLGAQVIKIERPLMGESGRKTHYKDFEANENNAVFQAINRGKQSYAANLKDAADVLKVKKLIAKADVIIQNFRPGVMERLGLDYSSVKKIKPDIIYACITGFGVNNEWSNLPGQDLIVQARSGVPFINGEGTGLPCAVGISIADIAAGQVLCQAVLAAYIKKLRCGTGCRIDVNMMEAMLDMMFQEFTGFLNDGKKQPQRAMKHNGHVLLSGAYGIYETADTYLALSEPNLSKLAKCFDNKQLIQIAEKNQAYGFREEVKAIIEKLLVHKSTEEWLSIFNAQGIWCADVLNWEQLVNTQWYKQSKCEIDIKLHNNDVMKTTSIPLDIDGVRAKSSNCAPLPGEHNLQINEKYNL